MKVKEIPNEVLIPEIKKFLDQGHTVTLRVKGRSMRPYLEGGRDDVVLQSVRRPLRLYDIILAETAPQQYMIHRIIRFEANGNIVMRGDGNLAQHEVFPPEKVLAVVVGFRRKGRLEIERLDTFRWRVYSRLWVALYPCRRVLLGIHRRLWLRIFPPQIPN